MKLAVVGDEIGTTLEEQIESLKIANISNIELRKINNKYLWEFTEAELLQFKKTLDKENIQVISLDSPCGKKPILYQRKKELFDIYIKISKIFQSKYIRIFSNLGEQIEKNDIIKNLHQYSEKASQNNIELIMENERATYAKSPVECLDLIRNENNVNILYDPENAFFEGYDIFESYEKSKERIVYIHVRDFNTKTNMYAYPGRGDLKVESFLNIIKENNFNGILSIETHLPMNETGESKRKLFLDAMKNFNEIGKKIGLEIK